MVQRSRIRTRRERLGAGNPGYFRTLHFSSSGLAFGSRNAHGGSVMFNGSCLCGEVTYEFEVPTENFVLCHCNRCKKASGSAFSPAMTVTGFKFLSGEDSISFYEAPLLLRPPKYRRDWCRNCGSPVPRPTKRPGVYVVWAGSLDDDPGVSPSRHVWVNCKHSWEYRRPLNRLMLALNKRRST